MMNLCGYDPESRTLYGWRLGPEGYVEIEPDENDRLWSTQLEAWLGLYEGTYQQQHDT